MMNKDLGNNVYELSIPQKISLFYGGSGPKNSAAVPFEGDIRSIYYSPYYL